MMLKSVFLAAALLDGATAWSYTDQAAWPENYCTGASNKHQSPIDIVKASAVKAERCDPLNAMGVLKDLLSGPHDVTLNNLTDANVHSIKWTFVTKPAGHGLKCEQMHCHFENSEHSFDGVKPFGECHVVCFKDFYADLGVAVASNAPDALAVFGFTFALGDANTPDDPVFQKLIDTKLEFNGNTTEVHNLNMPMGEYSEGGYYRYMGGLTTPTCNEVVQWTVFGAVQKISEKQHKEISTWKLHYLRGNAREVQPLNGRKVTFYNSVSTVAASMGLVLAMLMY